MPLLPALTAKPQDPPPAKAPTSELEPYVDLISCARVQVALQIPTVQDGHEAPLLLGPYRRVPSQRMTGSCAPRDEARDVPSHPLSSLGAGRRLPQRPRLDETAP